MLLFHVRAGSVKGSALPRDMPAVSTAVRALPRDLPAVSTAGSALPRDLPAVSAIGSALPRDLPAVSTAHVSTTLSPHPFSLSLHLSGSSGWGRPMIILKGQSHEILLQVSSCPGISL